MKITGTVECQKQFSSAINEVYSTQATSGRMDEKKRSDGSGGRVHMKGCIFTMAFRLEFRD